MRLFDRRSFMVASLATMSLCGSTAWAARPMVLVFISATDDRTMAIAGAFKEHVDFATRITYDLSQEEDAGAFIADQIRGMEIALVFAIGKVAFEAASREFASTPLLYVADAEIRGTARSEAVSSAVHPGHLLQRLKVIAPGIKSVGLVRTSDDDSAHMDSIQKAFDKEGLHTEIVPAATSEEGTSAVKGLCHAVDVVWLRPSSLWTGTALAGAYAEALQQKTMLVGFSRAHLKSPQPPAFVVESDPAGIGAAASHRAREMLLGTPNTVRTYAEPVLIGHLATLRAVGVNLTKKKAAALDVLVRK